MKILLTSAVLAAISSAAAAEIPDIDSSKWATNPRDYGMSPAEYINAESNSFFADFLGRASMNEFFNFQGLTKAADHWVVSPNLDTVYSIAVVNAKDGFTLELPEVGDRFIATQIITEDHMTPFYVYGGGTQTYKASDFATDFVAVGVRMGTDGTAEDVAKITKEYQPKYKITGAATGGKLPDVDKKTLTTVRNALLVQYSKLPNSFGAMAKRVEDVKDWQFFTYVTAGAWGLSANENAMYASGGPKDAKGNTCYTATFPKVEVKAFYSITMYGPEKYLMTNTDNIVSSSRGVTTNDDGSFKVAFGAEDCRKLAPNYVATPDDGWSFLLRAYRPDVEAFKAYEMPSIVPAN
ncbi:DUF1214 domain-containing protein [Falsihalocynthiibacter sp. S25ZX9]|uniref:DUF1214 domain-containing protein n=1 Tax=Falsihalocynthiibacter sp. S25ZX9 TaxID=3240870 RepID=UPI0035101398